MGTSLETILAFHTAKYQYNFAPNYQPLADIVGFDFREDKPVLIEYLNILGTWERQWVSVDELLPVLRSFEDLVTPLYTGEVPAIEVAKIILGFDDPETWNLTTVEYDELLLAHTVAADGLILTRIYNDWLVETRDVMTPVEVYDYLRSNHFALPVNGKPLVEGQDYIKKTS
jgi:hypothetical protein